MLIKHVGIKSDERPAYTATTKMGLGMLRASALGRVKGIEHGRASWTPDLGMFICRADEL